MQVMRNAEAITCEGLKQKCAVSILLSNATQSGDKMQKSTKSARIDDA